MRAVTLLEPAVPLLVFMVVLLLLATSVAASELELRLRDEDDKAVEVEHVEVLVWAWGDGRRFVHESEGGVVTVPLSLAWLEDAWPERAREVWTARLVIQADGYVPVVTRRFHWLGTPIPRKGPIDAVQIDFDGRQRVTVQAGERVAFRLALRRPRERWLRLVDEAGRPSAGIDVRIDAFGATQNHCGRHWPALKLATAKSDAEGRVRLPDGDFEYAFEIETPSVVMTQASDDIFPKRLFTALSPGPETIVRVRRFEQRRLRIHVTWQGTGVARAYLGGCLSSCYCGACCGPVGRADASGRIDMETFHPEQYDVIYFIDQDGKTRLWELDPSELLSTADDVIDLDLTDASPGRPPHSWLQR